MSARRIEWLGDRALLLRLGDGIDAALNEHVHDLAHALRMANLPGVRDIVPAYASVAVHYDPSQWAGADSAGTFADRLQEIAGACLARAAREKFDASAPDSTAAPESNVGLDKSSPCDLALPAPPPQEDLVEIPVCYGGDFGPDLADIARHAKLDVAEAIARHAAREYRVAMLGFAPGFPYLLGLDPALHAPRRANPRTRVPAGSVAIGGAQTGIYPRELPGGWQIIGRTPLALFDAGRESPALLAPGQRVRFRAIDTDEFARTLANG
jgi:KipI family sensor histidine kinase inhibitor